MSRDMSPVLGRVLSVPTTLRVGTGTKTTKQQ